MAPKQRTTAAHPVSPAPAPAATPAAPSPPLPPSTATVPKLSKSSAGAAGGPPTWDKIVANVAQHYLDTTPQRTKLLDSFMAFLVVVGGLQFVYCVLAGNYVRPSPPIHTHFFRFFVYI